MQFKENQTIYLQIAERISDEILLGHYAIGSRIPSVREYAALVEVNANTVMRSYEFLQTQGIIFNKLRHRVLRFARCQNKNKELPP